tara:strand:- start:4970 stop:6187 length:1218 start_codon:yes stop_codon:yes gene_type:complete
MKNKAIYFDYASTTPVDPRVAKKMHECLLLDGNFGNPSSRSHEFGWKAEEVVEKARLQVADLINADSREIVWTSGATESDNLAIKGAAKFYKDRGNHIITSKIEHKAVLDPCRQLEREGFEVTYLDPNQDGVVTLEEIKKHVKDETILISLMHINNELGSINDIEKIGNFAREKNIIFHVDAAQSIGKIDVDLSKLNVDLMSFSAHKCYGPKGMGALYIRRKPRVRLEALIHGGGHERGFRSGTLATHQIVGMGEAFSLVKKEMAKDNKKIKELSEFFWDQISGIEEIVLNGNKKNKVANITNVSFSYVEGESLIMALKDVAVSSGSACTSASLEPSYVLRALGRPDELAHSSIRFSFGRFTTKEEVKMVAETTKRVVRQLRELSPLWDMYLDGVDLEKVEWAPH